MSDMTRFEEAAAPAPVPQGRPGQATMVEQARAIAEVRAAVMIAMDRPRNRSEAIAEMREVCGIMALAERAFFRVPRGNEHVNGESIHLARELARCWGNIDYGVKELARDDMKGQSELLAFAWDLQTNARSEITFIVPHVKGKANRRLTGTQEIYENNASFAGRRLREAIFAVLPVWYKSEAADICHRTLATGGGKPLVQLVADMRAAFEGLGVTAAQLEKKRGRKVADFLPEDVAALRVIFGSLKRNEVTAADEFPADEPTRETPPPDADPFEKAASGAADAKQPETAAAADPIAPIIAQFRALATDHAITNMERNAAVKSQIAKLSPDDRARCQAEIEALKVQKRKPATTIENDPQNAAYPDAADDPRVKPGEELPPVDIKGERYVGAGD